MLDGRVDAESLHSLLAATTQVFHNPLSDCDVEITLDNLIDGGSHEDEAELDQLSDRWGDVSRLFNRDRSSFERIGDS